MADIFVGQTITWTSGVGDVELGVVDASRPGVAEGISRLLVRSIQDARSDVGGHLPGWLVDDIERNYISPDKVRSLWAATGHRFALRAADEIIGTVHVARRHDTILTADRAHNNVPASELPTLKPERHHQVVNVSVRHELRHAGLAARMFDAVTSSFRHLFDGDGLWVRADPPWHPWLVRLGFVHTPAFDVFLPEDVERTSGLPHAAFNLLHTCACEGASERACAMRSKKLQYVSFTRAFDAEPPRPVRPDREQAPASVDELGAAMTGASRSGARLAVRGAGSGPAPGGPIDTTLSTRRLDRVVLANDHVVVDAGATWRELIAALTPGSQLRLPPVVPGYVDATIGGSLSTGGIGKGSVMAGLAIDHVRELLVVTRDGRSTVCSPDRDAWLFEAMLGGRGVFGVIARATIPLVARGPRVRIDKRLVPREQLIASVDVRAYHAFATRTAEGWLTITATESDDPDSVPTESFVVRPATPMPDVCRVQAFFDRDGAERFFSDAEAIPASEVTVHPVRQVPRRTLLVPRVSGPVAYVITVSSTGPTAGLTERMIAHGGCLTATPDGAVLSVHGVGAS